MSTRCTIAHDHENFHLYQECFENDNVYLQLDGDGWAASLDTSNVDWREDSGPKPKLGLRIDVCLWRKIVEGWLASQWGQDQDYDHKKLELDPDGSSSWLESLSKNRKSEPSENKDE
jgi:hypothetical protein